MSTNTKSADFGATNTNRNLSIASGLGVGSSNCTMSCWVKIQTEPASGEVQTFLNLCDDTSDTPLVFGYQNNGGTKRLVFLRNRSGVAGDVVYYNTTLGTSSWHLIAIKWDGSTIKGWLDGAEVASVASSGFGSGEVSIFSIGQSGTSLLATDYGTSGYPKAFIDDVRVWNTARSDSDLLTDYTTPRELVGNESNLRAYYTFNSSLTTDLTANGYTLTNNNTVVQSTDVPFTGLVNLTMSAGVGAFTLTGNSANIGILYTLIASVGSYILTGLDVVFRITGFVNQTRHNVTLTNQSRNNTTFTNQTRN